MFEGLLTYAVFVAILTLIPGPDTMLVIRNVLAYGRQAGLLSVLGVSTGLFVHASLSALGLSLILVASAEAFQIVKLLGAAYLIFLGLQSVWSLWKNRHKNEALSPDLASNSANVRPLWHSFAEGVLTNILNPKVALFYLSVLPQFIAPTDPVFAKATLLAGIHFALGCIWLGTMTFFVNYLRLWLQQAHIKRALEGLTALIMISFGIGLILEK